MGLLLDFDTRRDLAIRQVEDAGVEFLNVYGRDSEILPITDQMLAGFIPIAGLFDADGNMIGRPISGGVPNHRAAIEAALSP